MIKRVYCGTINRSKNLALLLLCLTFAACADDPAGQDESHSVSMIHLIADAGAYNEKEVGVYGVLGLSPDPMLYLHRDDYIYDLRANAVRLDFKAENLGEFEGLEGKYVGLVGIVHAENGGGIVSIEEIEIVERAQTMAEFRGQEL